MRKKLYVDFECCKIFGARWADLHISEIDDLLGFSNTIIYKVYRVKENQSSAGHCTLHGFTKIGQ